MVYKKNLALYLYWAGQEGVLAVIPIQEAISARNGQCTQTMRSGGCVGGTQGQWMCCSGAEGQWEPRVSGDRKVESN